MGSLTGQHHTELTAMIDEDYFFSADFSVSTGLVPWDDPSEYVHDVTGKAYALGDNGEEDEAGEIEFRLVSVTEAVNRQERLYDVFDADSSTLEAVYCALFDAEGETKEELGIEPGWTNLLFVDGITVLPQYAKTSLRVQLIDTSIAMFCPDGLVVTAEDALELTKEEWLRLGFMRIAESPFVFRDQLIKNPYEKGDAGTKM